ncbi:universal stress protein [Candidatus Nitronereus thalassa]|uniref:Universal stress protein n=1 Tax=Candidatus Nitronereus thalassa TaxID=3020898 RepID=A0ABU3K8U1_9BACT|nr:universal stress protein [Candidatus Nitronereus thalassa]MDT7042829.1 universal stress protein [Candidatus Nitronereus thalassa]
MQPLIKRILFATDFSPCSEEALHYALHWGKVCEAPIDCISVLPIHHHLDMEGAVLQLYLDEQRKIIHPRLETLAKYIREHHGPCVVHELSGIPHSTICEVAKETGTDLIVLGTHGWSGIDRVLLGSTAERVVAQAPCPVLTIKSSSPQSKALTYSTDNEIQDLRTLTPPETCSPRHVVVAVDFSDCSQDAVEYAFYIAKEFDVQITLVHVEELPSYGLDFNLTYLDTQKEKRRQADKQMKELCRLFETKGITATCMQKEPPVTEAILRAIEETKANLLVMGTHGRAGLSRLLMGSVASTLLRKAQVPIITVHAGKYSHDHPHRHAQATPTTPLNE